jgi:uncharacterized protein (TIGR00725 family)
VPTRLQIAVVGAASCDEPTAALAHAVGTEVARAGALLLTGGRGGVMAAAARGARESGGWSVGVLPGADESASPPNEFLDVTLFTGLGQTRNQILVLSADAVIAIGGGWGTLSEIAFALKYRVPAVLLDSWELRRPDGLADPLLFHARTGADAVTIALQAAAHRRASRAGAAPAPAEAG